MKKKVIFYFGLFLLMDVILKFLIPPYWYISMIVIAPIIFSIFLSFNLYKISTDKFQFSYWRGLLTCLALGAYGTIIWTIFNMLIDLVFKSGRVLQSDTDILLIITFVSGCFYTFILSLITPFFCIKNKNLNQDIILDDENF